MVGTELESSCCQSRCFTNQAALPSLSGCSLTSGGTTVMIQMSSFPLSGKGCYFVFLGNPLYSPKKSFGEEAKQSGTQGAWWAVSQVSPGGSAQGLTPRTLHLEAGEPPSCICVLHKNMALEFLPYHLTVKRMAVTTFQLPHRRTLWKSSLVCRNGKDNSLHTTAESGPLHRP